MFTFERGYAKHGDTKGGAARVDISETEKGLETCFKYTMVIVENQKKVLPVQYITAFNQMTDTTSTSTPPKTTDKQ